MILNPELQKVLRHFFAQQPVRRAYIFGSVARGEARDNSDIDVLVELEKGATLFDHARMSWQLEDLLQHKVDIITDGGLSPHIQPFIARDQILVYEK
jgi:predicted nucleotidyltransferase